MPRGLFGIKLGMTRIFDSNRNVCPVTVIECRPCYVSSIRTIEKNGYNAVQLAFLSTKEKALTKPELGHLKKSGLSPFKKLKEIRDLEGEYQLGNQIDISIFNKGDIVKVTAKSKGKGFQGVVKRHGFGGGRMSHGSKFHRAPGSIGSSTFPSEVVKGKKMPGRMGGKTVTVRNLEIVELDKENHLIFLKGSVPGPTKSIVKIEVVK
ncbi:MAG: 50S ribosomal protein L3 [Leptonema sp. (in: bacteria)]